MAALFHARRMRVGSSPFWQTRKKPFDIIYDLYKMKQSHWLLCVGKSRHCQAWLTCHFSWNENLQQSKNWTAKSANQKSSKFLSPEQPRKPKAWMLPWLLQELQKYARKLAIAVTLEAIQFEFWTERSVSDNENLCSLWSVILKSVWNSVGDTF